MSKSLCRPKRKKKVNMEKSYGMEGVAARSYLIITLRFLCTLIYFYVFVFTWFESGKLGEYERKDYAIFHLVRMHRKRGKVKGDRLGTSPFAPN